MKSYISSAFPIEHAAIVRSWEFGVLRRTSRDVSADCRVTLLIEIPGEGDGLMASTGAILKREEPALA
ncbi:protein of unknown function [Paraburkholderia dioscoreae]|uniref:Uncharacterized protein n=1 Tax=Paraburkholderia dioscoreae TaxID=2604047 RepID=A0A5Q4ZE14_9BURK|nr:protein of unknown function [Paraburkholderia dioscoreae]